MNLRQSLSLLLIWLVITNCRQLSEPEKAAIEFCKCLEENDIDHKYNLAFDICEARIYTHYFYLQYYDLNIIKRGHEYGIDSVIEKKAVKFESDYLDYLIVNCCDLVGRCKLQTDTFFVNRHPILKEKFGKK